MKDEEGEWQLMASKGFEEVFEFALGPLTGVVGVCVSVRR